MVIISPGTEKIIYDYKPVSQEYIITKKNILRCVQLIRVCEIGDVPAFKDQQNHDPAMVVRSAPDSCYRRRSMEARGDTRAFSFHFYRGVPAAVFAAVQFAPGGFVYS